MNKRQLDKQYTKLVEKEAERYDDSYCPSTAFISGVVWAEFNPSPGVIGILSDDLISDLTLILNNRSFGSSEALARIRKRVEQALTRLPKYSMLKARWR